MIDTCPLIESKRVVLHPLLPSHADALFPIFDDAEVWKYTTSNPPVSLEAVRERYERLAKRVGPDGALWLNWAVERRSDHQITGIVQATMNGHDAEIAYVFGRAFWGQGLAGESTGLMIEFLRDTLHAENLTATIDIRNTASLRLLERLGFASVHTSDPQDVIFVRKA